MKNGRKSHLPQQCSCWCAASDFVRQHLQWEQAAARLYEEMQEFPSVQDIPEKILEDISNVV